MVHRNVERRQFAVGQFYRNSNSVLTVRRLSVESSMLSVAVQLQIETVRSVSKEFGEWYQKTSKTEDTDILNLLAFKIIAIIHNTLLATFINLLETVSKGLFSNRSQNRCYTFLDYRHVGKKCTYHNVLQAGKQKDAHPP
jgi:hypothetical protein